MVLQGLQGVGQRLIRHKWGALGYASTAIQQDHSAWVGTQFCGLKFIANPLLAKGNKIIIINDKCYKYGLFTQDKWGMPHNTAISLGSLVTA